jgi:PAS domain S-box-containing protein
MPAAVLHPSAGWSMKTLRASAPFVALLCLVVASLAGSMLLLREVARDKALHSEVLGLERAYADLAALRSHVHAAESASRGYLLTRSMESFREAEDALREAGEVAADMVALAHAGVLPVPEAVEIEELVRKRAALIHDVIAQAREGDVDGALAFIRLGSGVWATRTIETRLAALRGSLDVRMDMLTALVAHRDRHLAAKIVAAANLVGLFVLAALWMVLRERRRRRGSEGRLAALLDQHGAGVFVWKSGRFDYISPRLLEICGRAEGDIKALPDPLEILVGQEREPLRQRSRDARSVNEVVTIVREDGSLRHAQLHTATVQDIDGPCVIGTVIDVTERREAEIQLRQAEERFSAFFQYADVGLAVVDLTTMELTGNCALRQIVGMADEGDLSLDLFLERIDPAWQQEAADTLRALVAGEQAASTRECVYRHEDGRAAVLSITMSSNGVTGAGTPMGFFVVHDVTARRRAEREAMRLSQVIAQAPQMVVITDIDGRVEYLNSAFVRNTGYEPAEVLGRPMSPLWENCRPAASDIGAADECGGSAIVVNRRKDGSLYHCRRTIAPIRDTSGKVTSFVMVDEDVSHEVAQAEALARSEAKFRSLIEHSSDLICVIALDGTVQYMSPSVERLLGVPAKSMVGTSIAAHLGPVQVGILDRAINRTLEPAATIERMEYRLRHADGTWRTLEVLMRKADGADGVSGIIINARDLTERRLAEEGMRKSQERYRHIIAASADAILLTDVRGQILEAGPAAEALLGPSAQELVGAELVSFVPEADRRTLGIRLDEAAKLGNARTTLDMRRADGSRRIAHLTASALTVGGVTIGLVCILRDVTEDVAHEEIRAHTTKMAALGSMLAAMSHEMNDPLQAIQSSADVLLRSLPEAEGKMRELAYIIHEQALRCREHVRISLRHASAEKGESVITIHDFGAIANEMLRISPTITDVGVAVRLHADPGALVLGSRSEIELVFGNLMRNAVEAIVQAEDAPCRPAVVEASVRVENGSVLLAVDDSGPGIPDALRSKLFEPYFSTKREQGGSGIGLWQVYLAVKDVMNGEITVERSHLGGARFIAKLPLQSTTAMPRTGRSLPDLGVVGVPRKILLVDNQVSVRIPLAGMYRVRGHEVVEAESGLQALEVLRSGFDPDVMLTDFRMPGLGGADLYLELVGDLERYRNGFIVMTGGGGFKDVEHFVRSNAIRHLLKPFSIKDAVAIVEDVGRASAALRSMEVAAV